MAENTFLGLQPYTEADAYRFKGRTEESQELFRLIVRNDFTVCYAESGEGKTSLLNAGVFPLLRQNMYFPIAITFTSDDYQYTPDSFDTIIDRCIKDSITDYNEKNKGIKIEYKLCSTDFQDTDRQSALQQELSKFSWWKLRNYKPQAMGLTFTPVFVFDQFEEVFNLPGSIVWTKKFFDWLEDVSSDSCPDEIVNKVREIIGINAAFPAIKEEKDFKAVFSLRKEFIGELDYWGMQKCFIPSLKDNRYCLKALTYEGAKKVMTQQQRFEETKVEHVLDYFVQQYSREPEKTISENLPVIPALLLSVVCDSWEKDINYFSNIDANDIDQSLNKILEKFYDEAIGSVVNEIVKQHPQSGSPDFIREDIEKAMFDLVDVNGKRVRTKATTTLGTIRLVQVGNLRGEELRIVKYKKILSDHRIIKISKFDGEDYVEIVHDALCPIIAKRKELFFAAEAKKHENEKLRMQAQKNKKRMMISTVLGLVISGTLLFLLWQNNRFLKEQEARSKSETEKDFIQKQKNKVIDSLNLSEFQKASLQRQNDSIALLNDSISALYESLADKISVIEVQKEDMEIQYNLLVEQIERNKIQEERINNLKIRPVFDAVVSLSKAIESNDTAAISQAVKELQGRTSLFSSLRNNNTAETTPNSETRFNTDAVGRRGGQTVDGTILTKTVFIKAGQTLKYTFVSRGRQELAVVAEEGGRVTLRIHATSRNGYDARFDDTVDIKKGRQTRKVSFELPENDRRYVIELEIINCTQKGFNCVIISN